MAKRRMFTKQITDDDRFMSLSSSAQALYLHLSMGADDDGFCNQVTTAMFRAHASVDDLKSLRDNKYIIQFENGVIVIKHWRMANAIRKDRYTPTTFQEELSNLGIDENGSYTWLPDGCHLGDTGKVRLGKNSIDKGSLENNNYNNNIHNSICPPTLDEVDDYCLTHSIDIDVDKFYSYYQAKGWKLGKEPMTDWKAAVNVWQIEEEKRK